MATKTHTISLPCLLIALSLLQATLAAVRFGATNNASSTPGDQRFDSDIGISRTPSKQCPKSPTSCGSYSSSQRRASGATLPGRRRKHYTVLKSPFYVEGYSAPGEGERWDEGYGATSRFLEYCDSLREGFTPELNRMTREVYMPEYWNLLFGKDVDQVWGEYKAKYAL
ncbi:hypothetical protein SASPL_131528 [Salvia splendens]|uniref:Uncharacterized protein n=1 Tax=Salvia splendens TaxID=180675 RepID=A0A8X8XA79_SALSN|nr:hypothetical protein SASPL_131528 [Salvia splendens]